VKIQIAPSILSADYTEIGKAVRMLEMQGADLIHLDIMDGHFVPSLTFGPGLVSHIKKHTGIPLDVHLMVDNPRAMIPEFQKAGADWISIHAEATFHLHKDIQTIRDYGLKAGVALNPATPVHLLTDILTELDYVLIMAVNPGWGGQTYIQSCLKKISQLRHWISGQKLDIHIQVDGGIKYANMERFTRSGADILVIGSEIFRAGDPADIIKKIKAKAESLNET
jgi:ribulose-phosphate 3-epimerase